MDKQYEVPAQRPGNQSRQSRQPSMVQQLNIRPGNDQVQGKFPALARIPAYDRQIVVLKQFIISLWPQSLQDVHFQPDQLFVMHVEQCFEYLPGQLCDSSRAFHQPDCSKEKRGGTLFLFIRP